MCYQSKHIRSHSLRPCNSSLQPSFQIQASNFQLLKLNIYQKHFTEHKTIWTKNILWKYFKRNRYLGRKSWIYKIQNSHSFLFSTSIRMIIPFDNPYTVVCVQYIIRLLLISLGSQTLNIWSVLYKLVLFINHD